MQINLDATPLRQATGGDWKQLADITADAFAEDPVSRWIFGSPRVIKLAFQVMARNIYLKQGLCHMAANDAATMWARHDVDLSLPVPGLLKLAAGITLYGSRGAIARATHAGEVMMRHHPSAPHLYLFTMGVRKTARGRGLGRALLAPVLSACDRDGMPVYLENSNPANSSFYAGHGFERRQVFPCGEGGPPLEAMWREPRP